MKSPRCVESLDAETLAVSNDLHKMQLNALRELLSIWRDMGIHGEAKDSRLKSVSSHVSRLLQDMVEEEKNNKLMLVQRITQYWKDIRKLGKELSGETMNIPEEQLDSTPLYQVEKRLAEKWTGMLKVKEERVEQLEDLQKRLDDVWYKLGKKDLSPFTGGITEFEIEALKCRVQLLEQERDRLQTVFDETRNAIQQIFNDLDMMPTFPFDKMVLCEPSSFLFDHKNMVDLKKLHQKMEQKLSDSRDSATELRERLSNLWERLQISSEYRETFLNAHRGYSHPTLCALKEELKRCEALKKANIENFVCQLREEIVSWWERCYFSDQQKNKFQAFYYTDFNEDVLELHELEVNKLKTYYEKNRDIFQLADQRSELWVKMQQLEARANDPNRLFNNRGGQLLREERERNVLAKTLPKIEAELKDRLLVYQQENSTPFLINGENLLDTIEQQNNERLGMKELQKQLKKVTRNNQLEIESKLGSKPVTPTSVKRGRLGPSTPSMLGVSHKTLSLAARSAPPKTEGVTLKRKAGNSPNPNVPSRTQESNSKTRRNIMSHLPSDNLSIASGIGPYSEFQNQLELMSVEKACRSSVVGKNCLRELNTPVQTPSSVSSTTKLTLTPGRITTATHLTVKPATSFTVTPMKPPRRNGAFATPTPTQVRRTSTRLNLKSPNVKSPAPGNSARLTTPRSRLPIVF
ncbi:protein regulator of cytokinesis 1 isoform X2 [Frankliniella occidentalis]|uniref:Protein regulator of cytokinesis 1 isoform X2 n=1 Tax=Frankliniella occidentalis TaxID=133901 RepID=A0A6J1RYL8_FRAOC|nr:protein regulator of cytokinesis 1 isoform X2 [Frankliniella occidentalis]